MNILIDNLLSIVNRFANSSGPVMSLADTILNWIVPQNVAMAQEVGVNGCWYQWNFVGCATPPTCSSGCPSGRRWYIQQLCCDDGGTVWCDGNYGSMCTTCC